VSSVPYRSQPTEPAPLEVELGKPSGSATSGLWPLGLLVLGVALALATRFRIMLLLLFFPLGLGGLTLSPWLRRRVARLSHRTLRFETRGFGVRRRLGSVSTDAGVAIETRGAAILINGMRRTTVRVVGARGAVAWEVPSADAAEAEVDRLRSLLERGATPVHDGSVALGGAVATSSAGGGTVIEWSARTGQRGLGWQNIVLPLSVILLVSIAAPPLSVLVLPALVAVLAFFGWSVTRGVSTRTTLWIGREGWTLTRRKGSRASRQHGTERLSARLLGAPDAPELVMLSGSDEVQLVDDPLSRAELRFIAEQIERAEEGNRGDGPPA
jgi:hypothetical protein